MSVSAAQTNDSKTFSHTHHLLYMLHNTIVCVALNFTAQSDHNAASALVFPLKRLFFYTVRVSAWPFLLFIREVFLLVLLTAVSLSPPAGEGEEVHAAGRQPEAARCGERLHVQQAYFCPLQHRTEVLLDTHINTVTQKQLKCTTALKVALSPTFMFTLNEFWDFCVTASEDVVVKLKEYPDIGEVCR